MNTGCDNQNLRSGPRARKCRFKLPSLSSTLNAKCRDLIKAIRRPRRCIARRTKCRAFDADNRSNLITLWRAWLSLPLSLPSSFLYFPLLPRVYTYTSTDGYTYIIKEEAHRAPASAEEYAHSPHCIHQWCARLLRFSCNEVFPLHDARAAPMVYACALGSPHWSARRLLYQRRQFFLSIITSQKRSDYKRSVFIRRLNICNG